MSVFRDNLLAKNASFVSSADALLRVSFNQERYRALQALESLDRVRSGIQDGKPINQVFGDVGRLSSTIGHILGFGAKAVGPISELPLPLRVRVNEYRFVKTRAEQKLERANALRRTPDPGGLSLEAGGNSISLFPGETSQTRDQLVNKFGPLDAGMLPYSQSPAGRAEVGQFIGRVFPFKIRNEAKIGFPDPKVPEKSLDKRQLNTDPASEIFPAYINTLNEQFSVNWSSRSYIGRSEDVYVYNGASRSFNLDFVIFATNNDIPEELNTIQSAGGMQVPGIPGVIVFEEGGYPIPVSDLVGGTVISPDQATSLMDNNISKTDMWRKVSFLESLCYPAYGSDNRYSRTPFCRIDLGHLWENQLAIITSLSFVYTPMVWDINGRKFTPMFVNVTMAGTLIHDTAPGTLPDGSFGYTDLDGNTRFIHRSEFDNG